MSTWPRSTTVSRLRDLRSRILRFLPEGTALDFIQDWPIELDGELPLNTFAAASAPDAIHGLWHIIEGALQASGRAGSRQVKDANVSFVAPAPRS